LEHVDRSVVVEADEHLVSGARPVGMRDPGEVNNGAAAGEPPGEQLSGGEHVVGPAPDDPRRLQSRLRPALRRPREAPSSGCPGGRRGGREPPTAQHVDDGTLERIEHVDGETATGEATPKQLTDVPAAADDRDPAAV